VTPEIVVGGAFAAAGAVALGHGFVNLSRAVDSEQWPLASGEVLESVVATEWSDGKMYYPAVRYRYSVGGKSYEAERVRFGGPLKASWRSSAEAVVARYQKGRQVRVRYSPSHPELAVLEPGASWYIWFILLGGALFIGIGITKVLAIL